MKILHVYRTYFPDSQGGVQEAMRQIARGTQAQGVENRIFTLSENPQPGEIASSEGSIVRVQQTVEIASCGIALKGLDEFRRQAEWADLIHYHYPWPFGDALHLMAGRPGPSLVTYHSDIIRQQFLSIFYKPLMDRFLGSMDRIVATSPNYVSTSKVLASHGSKVEVVPLALDENSYPDPEQSFVDGVEQQYGRNFFLFIGVWRYYKGLHFLLEAAKGADYEIVVVGSGPIESEIRKKASRLELNNVRFPGQVDDSTKVALLRLCRALVLPSHLRSEAFGVTLLEGAMYSKPLISTDIGTGTSYANMDRETGLVIPPNSSIELRAAMDILNNNPDMAAAMGEAARQRFLQHFTGDVMGERYTKIYRDILSEQNAPSTQ